MSICCLTGTTSRRWLTRRLLVVLGLALAITMAGATVALAAPGHSSGKRHPAVHETTASTAGRAAPDERPASGGDGPSPAVPLVFAGILILAAAGPWMTQGPRSGYYRVDRHW